MSRGMRFVDPVFQSISRKHVVKSALQQPVIVPNDRSFERRCGHNPRCLGNEDDLRGDDGVADTAHSMLMTHSVLMTHSASWSAAIGAQLLLVSGRSVNKRLWRLQ